MMVDYCGYDGSKCNDCGQVINRLNTSAGRKTDQRCGKCYLKFKAKQRKERGEK